MHNTSVEGKRNLNNIYSAITSRSLLFTVLLSFVMALVLYWNFIITGTPLFMTAFDGWGQAWPYMAALSEYIWTDGFPQWHFGDGLGAPFLNPIRVSNPFRLIPVLLGRDILPYAMVWMQIIKIVLACLFFCLFLKKCGFHPYVCALVSLMYAFSGHMIIRGANWVSYGVEVVLIAFLLYSVELYFRDGKWKLIPVAIFLVVISLGSYYTYLYSIFLFAYATVRYLVINKFKIKEYIVFMLKCGVLYGIGILAAGIIIVPVTLVMLASSRGQGAVDSIGLGFILNNLLHLNPSILGTAFFRFFSGVSLGAEVYRDIGFGGFRNTLEAPLNYAGILMILLTPAFFYYASKKLRILGAVVLALSALYYLSPALRAVLNAFVSTEHFKLSSFWITIALLVMAAYTLDKTLKNEDHASIVPARIISLTSICLIVAFMGFRIIAENFDDHVRITMSEYIILFLLLYPYLLSELFIGSFKKKHTQNRTTIKHITLIILFVVVVFELFTFSSRSKTHFFEVQAQEFSRRTGIANLSDFLSRDNLIESISDIDDSFYRVGANISWFNRTRPLADGFFGSSFYTSVQNKYIDFLYALNVSPVRINTHSGLQGRHILQTLTSHKYRILPLGIDQPFGYSYLFSDENRNVFLNDYYLPLGFAYDTFITREQFDSLSLNEQKDIALLTSVVLDVPNDALDNADISVISNVSEQIAINELYSQAVNNRRAEAFQMTYFSHNHITGTIETLGDRMLFFSIPNAPGWRIYINGVNTPIETVNVGFIGAFVGEGVHHIELKYRLPGLVAGGIMSVIGFVAYFAFVVLDKKKNTSVKRVLKI